MTCSNCQHGWCWFCGFAVGYDIEVFGHDGWPLLFHIPCTIFVESMSSVKGRKKVAVVFLIILGIVLLPAIYALILAGYFIFGFFYGTYMIITQDYCTLPSWLRLNWNNNISATKRTLNSIAVVIEVLLFWVISVVLLAVAARTVLLCAFTYLLIIFSLFFATIQWCLKSRKTKQRSDFNI